MDLFWPYCSFKIHGSSHHHLYNISGYLKQLVTKPNYFKCYCIKKRLKLRRFILENAFWWFKIHSVFHIFLSYNLFDYFYKSEWAIAVSEMRYIYYEHPWVCLRETCWEFFMLKLLYLRVFDFSYIWTVYSKKKKKALYI